MTMAVLLWGAMGAMAQKIQVVDKDGNGLPLVSVMTESGTYIGTTDLNGVLADVKGATKVAVTHVAYKPQLVTVASLQDGRIVMEDIDYDLAEVVVKPKPYIYVEAFYRVYVYRNDSLCYFLSGIMPNAFDVQKQKLETGSYMQAYSEYCSKMGAAITWGARAQSLKAGQIPTGGVPKKDGMMEKYFVTTDDSDPNHWVYSNPEGIVGQFVRSGNTAKISLDAGRMQMYANKAKGQTKLLQKREDVDYQYQYTRIYANNEEGEFSRINFIMDSDHWEYNDKKSHVKFIIENYVTDHSYMDKEEWKAKKKEMKETYGSSVSLDKVEEYATSHNIPALSSSTRQAIKKLRQW